jgi:hypothetical protein
VTKSARFRSSSTLCALCTLDGSRHAASTVISGSKPTTFIPSLIAYRRPGCRSPRGRGSQRAARQLDAGERLLAVLDLRSRSPAAASSCDTKPSAGTTLRAAMSSAASTSSLTALALAPGALNTGTPRVDISATGMLFVPSRRGRSPARSRDVHRVHVVRAHEDRVRPLDRLADEIARRGQPLEALARRCD